MLPDHLHTSSTSPAQPLLSVIEAVCWCARYEDDRDEGEWFLYTGSGGRDLSGNKRVTNVRPPCLHACAALQTACMRGKAVVYSFGVHAWEDASDLSCAVPCRCSPSIRPLRR